ncbi:MAG: methyltransferase [Pseudomonadota bacterium]
MATEPATQTLETDDRLLGGRVRLTQPRAGYRAAIDPILLAAAVPAKKGQSVLDLGAGTGAVSLCLSARVAGLSVTALERQPDVVDLCQRNVAANDLAGAIRVHAADLVPLPGSLEASFDHVVANPPFLGRREGTRPPDVSRAAAHADAELSDWLEAAHRALVPKGWLTMIHRADRYDRIVTGLAGRFGAITLIPLWPRQGIAAKRVIVRARKGVRSPGELDAGLVLHDDQGGFSKAALAVLRDMAPI